MGGAPLSGAHIAERVVGTAEPAGLPRELSRRQLLGISVFWLPLSVIFDPLNALILPERVERLTASGTATAVGLLTFAGLAIAAVVQPLAGHASDVVRHRLGRRGVIAFGSVAILAGLALLVVAPSLAVLGLAYAIIQSGVSVAQAAQQGFIPDLVPYGQRGRASGLKGLMDLAGASLGFAAVGGLLGGAGIGATAGFLGAACAVGWWATARLVDEPPAPGNERAWRWTDSFRIDLPDRAPFVRAVAARCLFLVPTFAVGRFLLLFVEERFATSTSDATEQTGLILGVLALVTALAAVPAGRLADRIGRRTVMLAGALASAVGVALFPAAPSIALLMVFGALMAVGSAAFAAANWAFTADHVPPSAAGRSFGIANLATVGAAAVAGLCGLVIDAADPGGGAFTAFFLLASALFLLSAGVVRRLADRG
ncbi:MAG TPA: MFS transporter [Actinomycetota bacterium]|nr:MFS transporter [Actinomycetota bacterium]